jgi:hypothetical protein
MFPTKVILLWIFLTPVTIFTTFLLLKKFVWRIKLLRVGDVRCPDMVRSGDAHIAQQVGIDRMRRMPLAGVGLAIQRIDSHPLHQGRDAAATDWLPFTLEHLGEHPCPGEGVVQIQFVDPDASVPFPPVIPEPVGSRLSNVPVPVSGITPPVAVCGFGRSSLCAQQSRLGERAF